MLKISESYYLKGIVTPVGTRYHGIGIKTNYLIILNVSFIFRSFF